LFPDPPMSDYTTFREQLAIRYPHHGHALWDPDPGGLYDSVEVGDVGFIRDGCFHCIFNALLPGDPPSDSNIQHEGGSVYPPRLEPKTRRIRLSRDNHRDFLSKYISKEPRTPNTQANE
jgi:hypothetical protein